MELNHSPQFNEKLSQWISSQGFWFQMRYSLSGSSRGKALFHFMWLGFRLFLLLLVIAGVGLFYLYKRISRPEFAKNLSVAMNHGLAATETEVGGISRNMRELMISRIVSLGGKNSFYNSLEVKDIEFEMKLWNGLQGRWDAREVAAEKLELELRAGSDDEASSKKFAETFFGKSEKVIFNSLTVKDASIYWGYSARTYGAIENSNLTAQRLQDGWKLEFNGGTFSQNWLRKLEIVNLTVLCDREALVFQKAQLKKGEATIDFSGLKVIGGARPVIDGIAQMRGLDLEHLLTEKQAATLTGRLSGDVKVSGSTNSAEGVQMAGKIMLDSENSIILTGEGVPLLKALGVVDSNRNYRRIPFTDGSLELKTSNGILELNDIQVKSPIEYDKAGVEVGHALTLNGQITARQAKPDELAIEGIEVGVSGNDFASLVGLQNQKKDPSSAKKKQPGSDALTVRVVEALRSFRESGEANDSLADTMIYEGNLKLSLLPDAFARSPELAKKYLTDKNKRIVLPVPLSGMLKKITSRQADEIYELGRQ